MAKKVLVCSNAYPPHFVGGAELIAHFHARVMQQRGHDVTIFAGEGTQAAERYSMDEESYEGLRVFRVHLQSEDFRSDYENFYHPEVESHFQNVLDAVNPDVVHCHNLIGLSVGLLRQARKRGIRTVLTVHDHWGFCLKNTLLKPDGSICQDYSRCSECLSFVDNDTGRRIPIRMRRDLFAEHLEYVDFLISPSRYLAETYIRAGVPREKVRVIGYGMDLPRLAKIKRIPDSRIPPKARFTFVGYLGAHKGVFVLLDAMTKLQGENIELKIVGTGHLEPELREIISTNSLEENVRLIGKISNDEIAGILAQTDALVLPSVWPENQPVTILEAMAGGIAIIASRIGGIVEMVEDGVSGYLFSPGDADDLAVKMRLLAQNPEAIQRLGQNARAQMHETLESQADQILRVYEEPAPLNISGHEMALPITHVLCMGPIVQPDARQALNEFARTANSPGVRFLMQEWLARDAWKTADLLWVVDHHVNLDEVSRAIAQGIPILTSEQNEPVRDLCIDYGCGIFYRDATEALACLTYLLGHPQNRLAFTERGKLAAAVADCSDHLPLSALRHPRFPPPLSFVEAKQ